jgi:cell wall-associated NlpC family hydrolase
MTRAIFPAAGLPLGCFPMPEGVALGSLVGSTGVPRLVESARTFIGVPFKHRGRDRRGLDCAGLVWCAYAEAGVVMPDLSRYGREPHRDGMMRVCREALGAPVWEGSLGQVVPRALLGAGDVVVIRFDVEPHHMGILGPNSLHGLSLIHANGMRGLLSACGTRHDKVGRVMEHGLDDAHLAMICAVFRRPV